MQNVVIPSDFLKLAQSMGIPRPKATNLYAAKTQNRPVTDVVLDLLDEFGGSEKEARKAVNGCWKEYSLLQRAVEHEASPIKPQAVVQPRESYLDQARKSLEHMIGSFRTPMSRGRGKADAERIVVGSDLHGLFCDERAFSAFCADPAKTAIVAGDILDFISVSRFRQTIDFVSCREELADARAKLEALSASFETVYFVDGNHDKRALRRIQDIAPQLLPLIVNPLDLVASGLPNVHRLQVEVKNTAPRSVYGANYVMDYCGMVGDILVGHFDNFCGPDAPKGIQKWMDEWGAWVDCERPRVILQAHSHSLNSSFTPTGQLLISTGCLCKPMPYQIDGHGKYRPPTVGYVVLHQKDGITDLNRTQLVYLGSDIN